jgi:hypothetical protein
MALDFPSSPTVGQQYPSPPVSGVATYTWDGEKWTTFGGPVGGGGGVLPATATPLQDNTPAAVGTATKYAREDHQHPTDTTRAAVSALPAPATATPLASGSADVGTSAKYAREDHVHPVDPTRAPITSPTFLGDPKAPTPSAGDNDTSIATTAFVSAAIAAIGGGAAPATVPPQMDGTAQVGISPKYAREDHVHPTDTTRAPIASPVFTGDPQAPTPLPGDNDTSIATTAFVTAAIAAGGGGALPATAPPIVEGTAAVGTSAKYAREDHVHPAPALAGDVTTTAGSIITAIATGAVTFAKMSAAALATTAEYVANTASKILTTDKVWAAGPYQNVVDAATFTLDFNTAINFNLAIAGAGRTMANPTNQKIGQCGMIYISQDATGGRTITTWGTAWKFSGGLKPTLTATAGAIDAIAYVVSASNFIACSFTADMR